MHFGEYELSPTLIGLSLLPSGHPKAFQRLPVRPSNGCYPVFSLPKGRSLGFASPAPARLRPEEGRSRSESESEQGDESRRRWTRNQVIYPWAG